MEKKKGFLSYGKDDEPDDQEGEAEAEAEDGEESESEGSASEMRIQHLAEQTGVENPKALIKLIKACMAG